MDIEEIKQIKDRVEGKVRIMRRKWFKNQKTGMWENVSISDDEEKQLTEQFIKEDVALITKILKRVANCGDFITNPNEITVAIYNRLSNPIHFRFEELLNERKQKRIDEINKGEIIKQENPEKEENR